MINIEAIFKIESDGNPKAFNKVSGARGLGQITEACLTDYNALHPNERYTFEQLFDPAINRKIATWYLDVRIPELLEYYGLAVTVENILRGYNEGVGNIKRGRFPQETRDYIEKYNNLTKKEC